MKKREEHAKKRASFAVFLLSLSYFASISRFMTCNVRSACSMCHIGEGKKSVVEVFGCCHHHRHRHFMHTYLVYSLVLFYFTLDNCKCVCVWASLFFSIVSFHSLIYSQPALLSASPASPTTCPPLPFLIIVCV